MGAMMHPSDDGQVTEVFGRGFCWERLWEHVGLAIAEFPVEVRPALLEALFAGTGRVWPPTEQGFVNVVLRVEGRDVWVASVHTSRCVADPGLN